MNRIPPFLFLLFIYACQGNTKEQGHDKNDVVSVNDTSQMIQSFICGLWSLDSQNILNNEGYFFKPDGSLSFVASESEGEWSLVGTDSIKIKYSNFNSSFEIGLHIDSLTESRMILTDSNGVHLFRKVPFGVNIEENILSGFTGTLTPEMKKEYSFSIPSAKKIRIGLKVESDNVKFRIFDEKGELTSLPVKDWQAIMVRSGNYRIIVDYVERKKMKDIEFSLRVFGQ